MNENEYVSKINGYLVKDSDARTSINTLTQRVVDLENYTNVTELSVTFTGNGSSESPAQDREIVLPEGFTEENTIVVYNYLQYRIDSTRPYQRRFDLNFTGLNLLKDRVTNVVSLIITYNGIENVEYKFVVGVIKRESED